MTDRDDALDYIYKGWREGRQQRRDIRQQRGYDRTRRMLAPIMAQRARGAQSAVATPPSFADDVTTPDDESTPSIDEGAPMQQEMVSTPPAPITDERRMLPMQSEVQRPISDERRMLPPPQPTPPMVLEDPAKVKEEMHERNRLRAESSKERDEERARIEREALEEAQREEPKQDDKGMGEFFNPKMPSKEDLISEETHKPAFEEAFEEMVEPKEEPKPPKIQSATEEGKKQVMSRADELNEAVARSLGDKKPTPKEKKTESKPKAKEVDPPKEEVEVPEPPRLGGDPDGEDVLKVIEMVRDGNHKAQSELYNALGDLEDTNSPHFEDAKEAIEEYNSNMREELREFVEENKKKVDEKPKKKAEMKTQDLKTTIKRKPTKDEFTRALVKALPMKDLNLLQSALDVSAGWQRDNFSPVLVDELGRITNIMNVNNEHTAMMRIAEDPNTAFPMKPALMFPTQNVGKINPNALPNLTEQILEAGTAFGNKDLKQIYRDTMKRIKRPTKSNLEQALLSDEFSILDDLEGKTRPLTDADRKEIIASRPRQKKQQKLPELEYGSPFYVPSTGTWEMPILEEGRTFDGITPNQILGVRSIGGRDYTNANANAFVPNFPQFKGMKEVASISPSEFMKLIRNVQKDKRKVKEIKAPRSGKVQSRRVRIGESMYDLAHLKRIASGMDDDISSEKLVFTQVPAKGNKHYDEKAGGPIGIRGRGFEQYQAEPSYFDFLASPLFDDDEADSWTSMNDLFE